MPLPSYTEMSHAARRLRAAVSGAAPDLKDRLYPSLCAAFRGYLTVFTVQDMLLVAYLSVVAGLLHHRGVTAAHGARVVMCGLAALVMGCVISRATKLPVVFRANVYRATLFGLVVANYLMLREVLPLIREDSVDAALLRLDVALFGVAPVVWLERLNHHGVVEWFSFFYFSYFVLCGVYVISVLWLYRLGRHTTEFAIATIFLYCAGQLGYMAVPAYGPVQYIEFAAPLHGGLFWGWVKSAVDTGGALKDTFPSIHTAAPLWFTSFAFGRATCDRRWRLPAWLTAFFALNIMVSTLVLRWHYAVDLVAGAALGVLASAVGRRLAVAEEAARTRWRLPLAFSFTQEPSDRSRR